MKLSERSYYMKINFVIYSGRLVFIV